MADWIIVATWTFGEVAAKAGSKLLADGAWALDAAIAGAQAVEDDPTVNSVGYGGLADACGIITLDASVMDGNTLACGSVAGVENVRHVTAVARRVMDVTPHVMLVGRGAQLFAQGQGFPLENMLTPLAVEQWMKTIPKEGDGPQRLPDPAKDHDTVTVLARDSAGHLGGACSTSGLAHKTPGRVGDSPIIGAGLYVDDTAGAAGGTGVGEEIIRMTGAFFITESMRNGASAQEACERAVRRVNANCKRRGKIPARVAFLALDRNGKPGAACTPTTEFQYAVGRASGIEIVQAPEIAD